MQGQVGCVCEGEVICSWWCWCWFGVCPTYWSSFGVVYDKSYQVGVWSNVNLYKLFRNIGTLDWVRISNFEHIIFICCLYINFYILLRHYYKLNKFLLSLHRGSYKVISLAGVSRIHSFTQLQMVFQTSWQSQFEIEILAKN